MHNTHKTAISIDIMVITSARLAPTATTALQLEVCTREFVPNGSVCFPCR